MKTSRFHHLSQTLHHSKPSSSVHHAFAARSGNALVVVLLLLVICGLGGLGYYFYTQNESLMAEKEAKQNEEQVEAKTEKNTTTKKASNNSTSQETAQTEDPSSYFGDGSPKRSDNNSGGLAYTPFGAGRDSGKDDPNRELTLEEVLAQQGDSGSERLSNFVPTDGKRIPGVSVDKLHEKFELDKRGMKKRGSEGFVMSNTWEYVYSDPDLLYKLSFYGRTVDDLYCVQATFAGTEEEKIDELAGRFFKVISSLGFDSAKAQEASVWAVKNTGQNLRSSFGILQLELYAEDPKSRVLRITAK